jgi:FRG domain
MQNAATLDDYLSTVRKMRKEWNVPEHKELWFRAEDARHAATRLQPGLYRPRKDAARKSINHLLRLENTLYEEFMRCAPQLSDKPFGDDEWDAYFVMQHHGVPTRLLDWTDGALIALHFAVRNKTLPYETGAVVYAMDPWWLLKILEKQPDRKDAKRRWRKQCKRFPNDSDEEDWERLYLPSDDDDLENPLLKTPRVPLLWDSPHVSRRIAAQRSRFIICGSDPSWLSSRAAKRNSRIRSIGIPASSIEQMKSALRDAGITESVVYPDLDGLGRELKQMWEGRR